MERKPTEKKKILDFSKLKFETNWASATTIVTLLVAVITLYMNNSSLKGELVGIKKSNESLSQTVNTLSESVSALKGSQEITSKAIAIFMENPTGELKYRIENLEKVVEEETGAKLGKPKKGIPNKRPE